MVSIHSNTCRNFGERVIRFIVRGFFRAHHGAQHDGRLVDCIAAITRLNAARTPPRNHRRLDRLPNFREIGPLTPAAIIESALCSATASCSPSIPTCWRAASLTACAVSSNPVDFSTL